MRIAQEEAAAALDETGEAMQRSGISAEEWQQAQSEALQKVIQTYERFKTSATNAFDSVSQAAVVSVQEMQENLLTNQNALERWSNAVAVLMASDIPPALIQPIKPRPLVPGPASLAFCKAKSYRRRQRHGRPSGIYG